MNGEKEMGMDDYERSLYMRCLDIINTKNNTERHYICCILRNLLVDEGFQFPTLLDTNDIFLTFMSMNDEKMWLADNSICYQTNFCSAWWEGSLREPRIRILNFLLNER